MKILFIIFILYILFKIIKSITVHNKSKVNKDVIDVDYEEVE